MEWSEVIENESLQNLPFKIELNEWGHVVMSPASNIHGAVQIAIGALLIQLKLEGKVFSECSVKTPKGVKVADVAWASAAFLAKNEMKTPFDVAPELCAEVVSPSNSEAEMVQKRDLYFSRGAKRGMDLHLRGGNELFQPLRQGRALRPLPIPERPAQSLTGTPPNSPHLLLTVRLFHESSNHLKPVQWQNFCQNLNFRVLILNL